MHPNVLVTLFTLSDPDNFTCQGESVGINEFTTLSAYAMCRVNSLGCVALYIIILLCLMPGGFTVKGRTLYIMVKCWALMVARLSNKV
jgi:hypothetical protein